MMLHRSARVAAVFGLVLWLLVCARATFAADAPTTAPAPAARRPNIVLILADDLGVGDVGCYGQTKIKTPNVDRLAIDGVRFRQAYSPSPVCAPSRCCILTGLHAGHAYVRDNKEVQPEGQLPIPSDTITIAKVLKENGYATACIGKWGLGPVGSSGDPINQGFDYFFGHNCQRVAHNHYATHVWRNDQRVELDGNVEGNATGKQYTPDLMADDAIAWLRGHAKTRSPFFLYFATPLPHLALQAPPDAVARYRGLWDDPPFGKNPKLDYVSCDAPRATYAAMVTRVDEYVGRIMSELKSLGVDDDTVVMFASDNGPTFRIGGADSAFFNSAMGLRGLKQDVYEGGVRVPLIVRWPGHVKPGETTDLPTALYDFFPTACELAGVSSVPKVDGVSLLPTLTGRASDQRAHDYLYWEYHSQGGAQAVRKGNWKLVRNNVQRHPDAAPELYDLAADPDETTDVAARHADVVAELSKLMRDARTPSPQPGWNFEPRAAARQGTIK